ncbi:MAG: hypothetical protein SFV54_02015 [Bryobacteraceae bacterium]|nr:hypothetical protein [Bryobacteraceae bacterium]
MSSPSNLLVIGLPGTGKTTFLAALWHVAESEEIPNSLRLLRISDDARHLNSIKNEWQLFRPVGRSIVEPAQHASLLVRDPIQGMEGEIVFPDLSGESFRDQWKTRQWTHGFQRLVDASRSILLFVNPDKVVEPFSVAEMQRMMQVVFPAFQARAEELQILGTEDGADEAQGPERGTEEWNPELAPTQVQLVGLLQFLEPHFLPRRPARLAVIISAWDRVMKSGREHPTPDEWLSARLPYLHQYLLSQEELFRAQVWGISAQGGDLNADIATLREIDPASHRIHVEGPNGISHDITEPVSWALGWRR